MNIPWVARSFPSSPPPPPPFLSNIKADPENGGQSRLCVNLCLASCLDSRTVLLHRVQHGFLGLFLGFLDLKEQVAGRPSEVEFIVTRRMQCKAAQSIPPPSLSDSIFIVFPSPSPRTFSSSRSVLVPGSSWASLAV